MKGILIIIVFLLCAVVGFIIASNFVELAPVEDPTTTPMQNDGPQRNEYKVILVHVDRLDRPQPRMISVWFVSLFYVEGNPLTLTIAQIYPTPSNPNIHNALERSFALKGDGEPAGAFWKALKTLNIAWDGYVLVDDYSVQKVMEWTNGPGDYPGVLGATQSHPKESKNELMETCQSLGGIAVRNPAPFALDDLAPAHFRSNLVMDAVLRHWKALTRSGLPVACDVLLAP